MSEIFVPQLLKLQGLFSSMTSKAMASTDAAGYREVVRSQDQQQMATWKIMKVRRDGRLGWENSAGPRNAEVKKNAF